MTDEALNIASQCRATASHDLACHIAVDGGSGLLRELLIDAARIIEALTQPAQEPVATVQCIHGITIGYLEIMQPVGTKLYITPPQRPWVSLTDDQIKEIVGPWGDTPITGYTRELIDKIDAKLKENNNG